MVSDEDLIRIYKAYEEDFKKLKNGEIEVWDWLEEALEIMYIIDSTGEYRGAIIVLGVGGPYVELNTRDDELYISWGSNYIRRYVDGEVIYMIDEELKSEYSNIAIPKP